MATLARDHGEAIRLADAPAFAIGPLSVVPALRQVGWGAETRILEPRVMQVLVALGREPGAIVSRDGLIELCWDGRIVGENAIQRVVSLLRHLAADSGAFEIETITKVGYRLLALALAPAPAAATGVPTPEPPAPDRRALLIGGAAALAVAGGGLAWSLAPSPARREALRLHAAGLETQRRGGPENIRQAISFFEKAVASDPGLPAIWSDLARARYDLFDYLPEPDLARVVAAIKSAAGRALQLDPGNRDAIVTLALAEPLFRNWTAIDREVKQALSRFPDEPLLHERMGLLHSNTGLLRSALSRFRWLAEREPLVPDHTLRLAKALREQGDLAGCERLLQRGARLWPAEPKIWLARFDFLLLSGRAAEALAMTRRGAFGMGGASPLPAAVATTVAQALASGARTDAVVAIAAILEARATGATASFLAAPYLTALGAMDEAWEVLHGYYLGKRDPLSGERQPLPAFAGRRTDILFTVNAEPLRADPRFPKLIAAIGLEDYWRATGTRPDYRALSGH